MIKVRDKNDSVCEISVSKFSSIDTMGRNRACLYSGKGPVIESVILVSVLYNIFIVKYYLLVFTSFGFQYNPHVLLRAVYDVSVEGRMNHEY